MVASVAGVLSPSLLGKAEQDGSTRSEESKHSPPGAASASSQQPSPSAPPPQTSAVHVTLSVEARALRLKEEGESPSQIATMLNTTVTEIDSLLDLGKVPPAALRPASPAGSSALSA